MEANTAYIIHSNSAVFPVNVLTISGKKGMMVEIDTETGEVTFGEHYNLDETARIFWDGIGKRRNGVL